MKRTSFLFLFFKQYCTCTPLTLTLILLKSLSVIATEKHATLCLHFAPLFPGLQREKQCLISKLLSLLWNDLNKQLFLWSALESCLVIKPYIHSIYICTNDIAMFRFLRKRKVWIQCTVYVICTCLYVHMSCDEKCYLFQAQWELFVMNCDIL